MIGVAVESAERDMAEEFFELLKTPWEFSRESERYEVLICTSPRVRSGAAQMVLIFSGNPTSFDAQHKVAVRTQRSGGAVLDDGSRLPFYGAVATFHECTKVLLWEETAREPVAFVTKAGEATVLRIGYNLFAEASHLLTCGQPVGNADTPTLEMHIALLRDWITRGGLPLVEIPPVPDGYKFIACLTHDIDHPVLKNHRFDHTMFGFLYRSTLGSLIEVGRGRKPMNTLWRNWAAIGRLAFVHLGFAKDFWSEFDRYLDIEAGRGATYFVIPHGNYPGRSVNGPVPAMRACRYELVEVMPQLQRIIAAGSEVAVHGLDAWLDPEAGRKEREKVSQAVGVTEVGVRMHWLFFDGNSARALDQAGFSYDSTFGYRETIGFRAGTAQVFRPPATARLLELPLHVMDTALFYPRYLNLDGAAAERMVWHLLDAVERFGGALTINWHDRSIAPERLWDDFYFKLLVELERRGAWMPTAAQATSWFRKRRSAVLQTERVSADSIRVKGTVSRLDRLPGLKIRVHMPRVGGFLAPAAGGTPAKFQDLRLDDSTELSIAI
ncbi:MAG: hypothetical protein ABSD29_12050 [Verrucomicrobiota bacterium]|jgi:hypothetical protein